ncbi:D-tyrosyl-tRNA(Tyr) deacylase [bacterium]|nr:D-tyrosyl-tRNA(Tyr) deacylase [bacterium]
MRIVLQRVGKASVSVDGKEISAIGRGLLLFIGIGKGSSTVQAEQLAKKISQLRIFSDNKGKMNLSVRDISGEVLLISQFTLYASTKKGNRPSFTESEEPVKAKQKYLEFAELLERHGVTVKKGIFGANMAVTLENDGPVTLVL